LKSNWRKL